MKEVGLEEWLRGSDLNRETTSGLGLTQSGRRKKSARRIMDQR